MRCHSLITDKQLANKQENMRKTYFKQLMLFSLTVYAVCPSVANANTIRVKSHVTGKIVVTKNHRLEVTGTVTDNFGNPLFGVKVSIKETGTSVSTDKNGKYKISAVEGDILIFTLNGYLVKEVEANQALLNISLGESQKRQATTPVLYGEQSVTTNLQSTSTVYNNDLIKVPVAGINNALSGRLAGLYTLQSSGRPGADGTSITVRGNVPLVLVNGVPRDYPSIDPEEIESVTILKDGLSTVMLGQQSSNSVVMITTRKGEVGKQRISLTAQAGLQSAIKLPQPLGAFDYATLYNEALANDGKAPRYTAADLNAWATGSDPVFHPDVDWYGTILKPNTVFSRYNLNTYGGGNSTRYFLDVDYLNQSGILKQDDQNTYSTNTDYKRYLVRTNIDIDITPTTLLNLNLFGRIQNGNQPGGAGANTAIFTTGTTLANFGGNNIFAQLAATPNNAYPIFNPNGSLAGSSDYQTNLWAATTRSGYFYNSTRDVSADISLRKTLDNVTKGLWLKALASFNTSVSENIIRTKQYAVYKLASTNPDVYQKFGVDGQQINLSTNSGQSRNLFVDFSAGLDKTYGNHSINALLKYNSQSAQTANQIPMIFSNLSGRVDYNYKEKYLAEVALSYSGLNRYEEGNRFGFFYGFGLGWNIAKEDFLKDTKWLNALKVRANYAYTGNANAGYFAYKQYYVTGGSYNYGTTPTAITGTTEGTLANANITWEKANQYNLGIDASLFNNKLSIAADYFNNENFDLIQTRGRSSALLGTAYPAENIGISRYSGVEFDLKYSNNIGNFNYYIAPNVFSLQKIIQYQDEIDRPYSWMVRTGQREDQTFGYIADGLFQNQAEINSSAKIQGYSPVPGDIKYKDLNSDGIINELDIQSLKNNNPVWFYGLNLGFSYKGFDFSALLQGVQNRYVYVSGSTEWAFQNNGLGQAFEQNLGRWTPATAAIATQPRLTIGSNPNNEATSSYWLHDGSYVRLKNVELGYTLPKTLTNKLKLASIRFFVNAVNAVTLSAYDRVDPEVYGNGYPLQRVVNAGLNVKF
ncbi:SusC/RagA family TonB-linked outer membrane protein [Pedobacter psychrodurus]|uniref:SusC/RagA family TonB-linked outer membrane protein n=2 Tax=Pedobacter psychrodurus TaxID=2530456 RepID=A0A4R0PTX9_9SPHI|nr:SusC/RagA family TonB-linked outer membrane protein [Pedobacter psychrodurus]